jgi:hypothetical protein
MTKVYVTGQKSMAMFLPEERYQPKDLLGLQLDKESLSRINISK